MHKISIIIPCFNEQKRLPDTIIKLKKWLLVQKKFEVELILSNDGSSDDTIKIMYNCKFDFENQNLCIVKVLDFKHRGYIETLFDSYKKASNDVICNMEADCSILPENFEIFSDFISSFDMIQGSRILKVNNTKVYNKSILRTLISKLFSLIFRSLFKCKIYDPQCGFKMIKKEKLYKCLDEIKLKHDGLKVTELTIRFLQKNYLIKEIPVVNFHDNDSRLVPKFSIINPFPFIYVIYNNFVGLYDLYKIFKKENYFK
jgi:glycosyltransferase involved in cell wall biosynthesis